MSKTTKIVGLAVTALGGTTLFNGCGWGGFWDGIFQQGIVDNWLIDMVLDWLREDIGS